MSQINTRELKRYVFKDDKNISLTFYDKLGDYTVTIENTDIIHARLNMYTDTMFSIFRNRQMILTLTLLDFYKHFKPKF